VAPTISTVVQRGPGSGPRRLCLRLGLFRVLTTSATRHPATQGSIPFTYPTPLGRRCRSRGCKRVRANFGDHRQQPPRNVRGGMTRPGIPAATAPARSPARRCESSPLDGVDLVNANDQAEASNTLNAGLSPQTVGESHSFFGTWTRRTAPRTVTLGVCQHHRHPVQNVKTIPTAAETLSDTCSSRPHRDRTDIGDSLDQAFNDSRPDHDVVSNLGPIDTARSLTSRLGVAMWSLKSMYPTRSSGRRGDGLTFCTGGR